MSTFTRDIKHFLTQNSKATTNTTISEEFYDAYPVDRHFTPTEELYEDINEGVLDAIKRGGQKAKGFLKYLDDQNKRPNKPSDTKSRELAKSSGKADRVEPNFDTFDNDKKIADNSSNQSRLSMISSKKNLKSHHIDQIIHHATSNNFDNPLNVLSYRNDLTDSHINSLVKNHHRLNDSSFQALLSNKGITDKHLTFLSKSNEARASKAVLNHSDIRGHHVANLLSSTIPQIKKDAIEKAKHVLSNCEC